MDIGDRLAVEVMGWVSGYVVKRDFIWVFIADQDGRGSAWGKKHNRSFWQWKNDSQTGARGWCPQFDSSQAGRCWNRLTPEQKDDAMQYLFNQNEEKPQSLKRFAVVMVDTISGESGALKLCSAILEAIGEY